jgi:hypothetical protein
MGNDLKLEPTGFWEPLEEAFDKIAMIHPAIAA